MLLGFPKQGAWRVQHAVNTSSIAYQGETGKPHRHRGWRRCWRGRGCTPSNRVHRFMNTGNSAIRSQKQSQCSAIEHIHRTILADPGEQPTDNMTVTTGEQEQQLEQE